MCFVTMTATSLCHWPTDKVDLSQQIVGSFIQTEVLGCARIHYWPVWGTQVLGPGLLENLGYRELPHLLTVPAGGCVCVSVCLLGSVVELDVTFSPWQNAEHVTWLEQRFVLISNIVTKWFWNLKPNRLMLHTLGLYIILNNNCPII